jgi:hypothetical protein
MYNDILMNGSKKFVVSMSHPSSPGQFASVGVVFEVRRSTRCFKSIEVPAENVAVSCMSH